MSILSSEFRFVLTYIYFLYTKRIFENAALMRRSVDQKSERTHCCANGPLHFYYRLFQLAFSSSASVNPHRQTDL